MLVTSLSLIAELIGNDKVSWLVSQVAQPNFAIFGTLFRYTQKREGIFKCNFHCEML